jgi:aspartate aminotransferase
VLSDPDHMACGSENDFKLTPQVPADAIGPRTRWVILNSPPNPTGAIYTREELAALADVLLAHPHRFSVLSDHIYEHLIFDGAPFYTIAQVEPRLSSHTLTMNGVSKA